MKNNKTDWSVVAFVSTFSFIVYAIVIVILFKDLEKSQKQVDFLRYKLNEVIINKRECPGTKLNPKEISL